MWWDINIMEKQNKQKYVARLKTIIWVVYASFSYHCGISHLESSAIHDNYTYYGCMCWTWPWRLLKIYPSSFLKLTNGNTLLPLFIVQWIRCTYFVCRLCSPRCKKNNNKTIMNFGFQPFTCIQKWKHPERRQEPEFQISKEVTVGAPNWCILSFAIKYSSLLQYVALHPLTL